MTQSEEALRGPSVAAAPDRIREQLERILASREFVRAERMSRFLRHIVEASIEGRAGEIKERTIGIQVFDRPPDWDPKLDNIVRSEARRLRAKLEQYYAGSGSGESIRIEIPKGAYAPDFIVEKTAPPLVIAPLPPLPAVSKPRYSLALVGGMCALAVLGIYVFAASRDAAGSARVAEDSPLANEIGAEISPAISSDGKFIAYAWDGNKGNFDVYLKPSDGGPDVAPKRLTHGPGLNLYPSWSPDDRTLAFVRIEEIGASILTRDMTSGRETLLVRVRQRASGWTGENAPYMDIGPAWLPDGRSVIFSDAAADGDRHGLYRVDLNHPQPVAILNTEHALVDYFPRVSPDGRQLAFVRYMSHGVSDLFLCSIDGSHLRRLTSEGRAILGLAWAPDGRSLNYTSWHQGGPRMFTIKTSGGAQRELMPDSAIASSIAMGPHGDWMAYTSVSENWNIWRMPLHELPAGAAVGPPQRFIASTGRNHGPSFSPDGRHLAFISDRTGAWQVWLADPNGENPRQLSRFNGGFLGSVNWSPDSRRIAFDARPSGNSNIYLLDADRGGTPTPLDPNRFEERMPSWSADGSAVYFNSNRDDVVTVWRKSLVDGSAHKAGLPGSFKSLTSGGALYFNIADGELFRAAPDGSNPVQLPGVVSIPEINWALSGATLYYTQQEADSQIAFYCLKNGKTSLLTRIPGQVLQHMSNLAVSPDGKWLLFAKQDESSNDIVVRRFRDRRR